MNPPETSWSASPAVGTMLAQLMDLYARALRVDAARKAQRMERLAALIKKRNAR